MVVLLVAVVIGSLAREQTPSPASGLSVVGLLQQTDLHYTGSFRLPQLAQLQYGGSSVTYHDGGVLVQMRDNAFVDVAIPTLGSGAYATLPEASVRATYASLDDGKRLLGNPPDTNVRGTLFVGPDLLLSVASYYDASYAQTTTHLLRLADGTVRGPYAVGTLPGHVAGYLATVPAAWQVALGGPVLTGNFGLPIVTRESYGPAAFAFDPADLGHGDPVPAVALLDYPAAHPLAAWDQTNPTWTSDSRLGGLALIGRSLLVFGTHGLGAFCYGMGECVDPESSDHGSHSWPYVYRIWAYDLEQLAAVRRGDTPPWTPYPYGVWNITLPLPSGRTRLSVAYDGDRRLFFVQGFSDTDPAQGWPVVHVFTVK